MKEVKKMYDAFEMKLTPQAEEAMTDYINHDPKKNVYGKHVYKNGLDFSRQFIQEKYKEYIELMATKIDPEYIV